MSSTMQIKSTSDISIDELSRQSAHLPREWQARVDEAQLFMKAMEVPSWVSIVAQAPWWLQFLAASASVYVSGFISEAGKDTWKNRGKIAQVARAVPSAISTLADFISSTKKAGSSRTFVTLGIPLPDEYSLVQLRLDYETQEELEFEIALFVHYVPAIEAFIERERLNERPPVGAVVVEFGSEDFSLAISWMDRQSLERKSEVLLPVIVKVVVAFLLVSQAVLRVASGSLSVAVFGLRYTSSI